MSNAYETLTAELQEKSAKLQALFTAKPPVDGRPDMTIDEVEQARKLHAEVSELGEKRDLVAIEMKNAKVIEGLNTPIHPSGFGSGKAVAQAPERKSLGEQVVASLDYKSACRDGMFRPVELSFPNFDIKTTMTETVAGYAPPNDRGPVLIYSPQRTPVVADLIPSDPTDNSIVKYMEETTFTNNAAMKAEAAAAGESALAYTERTSTVEWLPVILPVTEQQLQDVAAINGIINNRLMLQLEMTKETQILSGTGSTPQLQGILTKSGIGTQAKGSDSIPDAVLKAITSVRFTGFANASGYVTHPTDWQSVQLLKTADGLYIWGNPSGVGPERIWGLPVVVTPAISQGTGLVGGFDRHVHISYNKGVRMDMGFVNDDFSKGKKTIRLYIRLSLEIYRASAFATVTGM